MPEWAKLSLSLDQVQYFKEFVTCKAPYASRVSLGFALGLAQIDKQFREGPDILRELDFLEGLIPHSSTKEAAPLRPPLRPFWHKHFFTSRHLIRNIGERWGLGKNGNRDLSAMIEEVAVPYRDNPDLWQKRIAYQLWIGGLEDRSAEQRMTGDWIIFAKDKGQNFYLGLATHEEAMPQVADQLYEKLRGGSACEFPFLFE